MRLSTRYTFYALGTSEFPELQVRVMCVHEHMKQAVLEKRIKIIIMQMHLCLVSLTLREKK